MLRLKVFTIFIPIYLIYHSVRATQDPPRIAVVGAGIGGTSVSYFLQDLFRESGVLIDIYESRVVGGRLATVNVGGQLYEAGGSIVHPDNIYMARFSKMFGLHRRSGGYPGSKFALYDGKEIVFSESDWEVVTWMKMFWRYGWSPIKLNNIVENMLSDFTRIYQLQERGKAYSSVEDLLQAMNPDFVNDVKVSSEKGFANLGISNLTINEIIMAGLIVNYGQTTAAHKFVGSVSSATGNGYLWSVAGGNKQVPEMLLKYSRARLIQAEVRKISLIQDSGKFNVSFILNSGHLPDSHNAKEKSNDLVDTYDIVIVATPLTSDTTNITFENFPSRFTYPEGKYHRTVCTMVKGEINNTYFGIENGLFEILSIKDDLKINSVGLISDVHSLPESENLKVWKVFSQNPLTYEDLGEMFSKLDEVKVINWLAYPHYKSKQKLGSFMLHEKMYHVNAIEWAASAMEMSIIGAKNIALLAYKDWVSGSQHFSSRDEL